VTDKSVETNKKVLHFTLPFCILIFAFFISASSASAATLYFSPSSGNQTAGNILNVNVVVNTQGKAINNADANIRFPTNLLEVVSVSKSGSIFTLWVEEPRFSNVAGTISLNGGLPTPGYTGTAGRIVTITFRLKTAGSASLVFTSGAVRANDGLGTDVLGFLGTATYTISPPPVAPIEPTPPPVVEIPSVVEEPEVPVVETPPEPVEVTAEKKWLERTSEYIDSYNVSGSFFMLMSLVILLAALLMYGRSRFVRLRTNIRHETYDVEKVLHHSFDTIKEDVVACVGLLERAKHRRHLTEEERAVISLLKQHLRETEKIVTKELHDIRHKTER
jgi:hypothetical protein